jgi:branched-chain amino acid transport system permease protein
MLTAPSTQKTQWITKEMLFFFAIICSAPFWLETVGLYQYLGVEIAIWMIFALGYNLLLGYTKLPSFGHGAYFGVGAYAFGLTQLHLTQSLWLGLALAIIAPAIAGAIAGAIISHRRGIYYALMTIGVGQVFWFISMKWHGVTGGEDGLLNIPRPDLFGYSLKSNEALLALTICILMIVVIALWRLVHSPFGKALQAVKQNEMRAAFIGYNVWLYKWLIFVISAGLAGLAGGLFAMAQESAYPDVMSLHASGFVVMMTLIGGGFVSFWGPVLGAVVYFLARDLLGAATETWLLWYGLLFMAVILFQPEGVAGIWQKYVLPRLRTSKPNASAPQTATKEV